MTTTLPAWDDMSDLDKGAALLHLHKRVEEGPEYAAEHYPCEYLEHPELIALSKAEACEHAAQQLNHALDIPAHEHDRLYDLAQEADHAREEVQ